MKINYPTHRKPHFTNILTKDFLEEQYLKEDKSITEICNEVGCKRSSLYRFMKIHNIPRKSFNRDSEIGNKFYSLTVIQYAGKDNHPQNLWLCRCECGNNTIVSTGNLRRGKVKTCGCSKYRTKENNHQWKGCGNISGEKFGKIKAGALKRNLEFDITIDYINNLLISQNYKCAITDLDITNNASLDRIDSSKGYIENNVQWVHKDINVMKWNFSMNQFIKYCQLVILKHKESIKDGNAEI